MGKENRQSGRSKRYSNRGETRQNRRDMFVVESMFPPIKPIEKPQIEGEIFPGPNTPDQPSPFTQ